VRLKLKREVLPACKPPNERRDGDVSTAVLAISIGTLVVVWGCRFAELVFS
jgi:hypothetical protein